MLEVVFHHNRRLSIQAAFLALQIQLNLLFLLLSCFCLSQSSLRWLLFTYVRWRPLFLLLLLRIVDSVLLACSPYYDALDHNNYQENQEAQGQADHKNYKSWIIFHAYLMIVNMILALMRVAFTYYLPPFLLLLRILFLFTCISSKFSPLV